MTYSDLISKIKTKQNTKNQVNKLEWVTRDWNRNGKWSNENIYMRSSNCWHWKLLSYHVSPNNWFVALAVPVRLQPFPVNDCCACVSLFVSRIFFALTHFSSINWFELIWNVNHTLPSALTHTYVRTCAQTQTTYVRNSHSRVVRTQNNKWYLKWLQRHSISNQNSTYEFAFDTNVHRAYTQTVSDTNTGSHSWMDVRTHDECIHNRLIPFILVLFRTNDDDRLYCTIEIHRFDSF